MYSQGHTSPSKEEMGKDFSYMPDRGRESRLYKRKS